MNKLAIVYWSGTGNTETMANCIADGARESGAEVAMLSPGEFSATRFSEFGVVAFGCPPAKALLLRDPCPISFLGRNESALRRDFASGKMLGRRAAAFWSRIDTGINMPVSPPDSSSAGR